MVLLKPGWQHDYEGRPPVYPIGCTGVMTHVEQLPDGRFNIVLRGVERFHIQREEHSRSYRRAWIETIAEEQSRPDEREALRHQRSKLEALLAPALEHCRTGSAPPRGVTADARVPATMPDADLINTLAQYLDLEPLEKQALLERRDLRARAESLVELLEMKMLIARTPGLSNVAH
jgi:uncharacterized protein